MSMPMHPEIPFAEGDSVQVKDHDETRENTCYAYLIGEVGIVTNPRAGTQPGKEDAIVVVRFEDGDIQHMFHWRLTIIYKQAMWEV